MELSLILSKFKIDRELQATVLKTLQWLAQTSPAALRDCHTHR
jgi:hypothetical protein